MACQGFYIKTCNLYIAQRVQLQNFNHATEEKFLRYEAYEHNAYKLNVCVAD